MIPYHLRMIKLQLLLRHAATQPELDADLRAKLEKLGIHITGNGRVTVSAEISPADYEKLFHARPLPSGRPKDSPDLPIPASLEGAVTLITVAPQHVPTEPTGKGKNAAI
jgi:hypothetical protein